MILVVGKVLPLVVLVAVGLFAVDWGRVLAASPARPESFGEAVLLLLFAYAGFENTAAPAGEFKHPRRDVPFALLVMITGVTLIYTLVQIVGLSVLPDLGESETPLAEAAGILLGPFGAWLLTIGAALSILGTTNNTVLAGSRYLYALAASGRLPAVFAGVHPRFQTPWIALGVQRASHRQPDALHNALPFGGQHGLSCPDLPRSRPRERELASFTERMIGAAKLDVHVYEEVEADTSATSQATGVVLLSSLAGGIGSVGLGAGGLSGFVGGGIAALIGWVIWAFLTYIIGTRLLPEPQTRADAGQLMRTLGFAQSPGLVRIVGIVPGVGPFAFSIVSIWMLVAMVIAVRQALDYTSTFRAVGVCLVGWGFSIAISVVFLIFFGSAAN